MNAQIKQLLGSWHEEINILMQAHYDMAIRKKRMNYVVGIPLIMLEILIASYMIFSISNNPSFQLKMIVGALVILAAILAALQTFLKYSEQAEDHRNAHARFRNLMVAIDQTQALPPRDDHALSEWCDKFRERWGEVSLDAPVIPKRLIKAKEKAQQSKEPSPNPNGQAATQSEENEIQPSV